VALSDDVVTGVFDFDTAHPAPRLWDVAFSVYCWAPFKTDTNDRLGTLAEQLERARIFCDSYRLSKEGRTQLVETMIRRIQSLVDYIVRQAANGSHQFQSNIDDGHHLSYLEDIQYLSKHKDVITQFITS
jgi:aminoglycoside phosphotransferase (APT) family kinase protein